MESFRKIMINFSYNLSIESKMLDIQEKKKDLISGAFRRTDAQRRAQRVQDIRALFGM